MLKSIKCEMQLKWHKFLRLFYFAVMLMMSGGAQTEEALPNHDIVLFDLTKQGETFRLANPQIVAASPGYDNQPQFSGDGRSIYFTRMEKGNADIWLWDPQTKAKTRKLTSTPKTSEYSPTPLPFDKASIATVRVEEDGTQRLWRYDPKAGFSLLFDKIKPVGYHVWSGQNVALFVLGEPHQLQVTGIDQKQSKLIDSNIGRCLQNIPDSQAISYTRESQDKWLLKSFDFASRESQTLMELPGISEDYVWYSKQQVIASDDDKLLIYDGLGKNHWQEILNLSNVKLKGITRLAISPDRKQIAVVYLNEET